MLILHLIYYGSNHNYRWRNDKKKMIYDLSVPTLIVTSVLRL